MEQYIGTKVIHAEPAPAPRKMGEHKKGTDGYTVVYEDGYESWSPKEVFEAAYRKTSGMTFGQAVEMMRAGYKVVRHNQRKVSDDQRTTYPSPFDNLILTPSMPVITEPEFLFMVADRDDAIYQRYPNGEVVRSRPDVDAILAYDWEIVE